jgi:hypothetical protein
VFHYTDDKGFKAISSQVTWVFKAEKPPGDHPVGAYFTTLAPGTPCLAKRLFVRGPKEKVAFVFSFGGDSNDFKPLAGGRGAFIFYSPVDYHVEKLRQGPYGKVTDVEEQLK